MPTGFWFSTVMIIGSKLDLLMRTCSMAPLVARMPCFTPPPSKAGPAEHEQESSQSRLPRTISPLVPMSMYRVSLSVLKMPEARMPAVMSPPT